MEPAIVLKATINNPDVGDMFLNDQGEAVFLTDLGQQVTQRLTVAFNFFKGEYPYDLNEGTPWFQAILGKTADDRTIRSVFTQIIAMCEGVDQVTKLNFTRDSAAREVSLDFECKLKDGSTYKSTDYADFVIAA